MTGAISAANGASEAEVDEMEFVYARTMFRALAKTSPAAQAFLDEAGFPATKAPETEPPGGWAPLAVRAAEEMVRLAEEG